VPDHRLLRSAAAAHSLGFGHVDDLNPARKLGGKHLPSMPPRLLALAPLAWNPLARVGLERSLAGDAVGLGNLHHQLQLVRVDLLRPLAEDPSQEHVELVPQLS
jgi:hypothetical protein